MEDSLYRLTREQLAALVAVSRSLISSIDLSSLLPLVVNSAVELLQCEAARLFLIDQTGEQLVLSAATSVVSGVVKEHRLRLGEGIAGWVGRHHKGLIVNDARKDPRFSVEAEWRTGFETQSVLAVPLVDRRQVVGVVETLNSAKDKPFDQSDLDLLTAFSSYVAVALRNAEAVTAMRDESKWLKETMDERYQTLIAANSSMKRIVDVMRRVAQTNSTVLLLGESGVGKEIMARSLHHWSPRAAKPFVAVNCVALSDQLIESELFGHEKGAFTGAYQQRKGLLEIAQGGTVFLDEIGEMKPDLQAKLLRVLQDREFDRVGGTQPVRVDIRVIAATNQDLRAAIAEGRFRKDLFFRLNVVSMTIPPLRQRREDIPLLARYFVDRYAKELKRPGMKIHPDAIEALWHHHWPGNVRELANVIERAVVLAGSDVIGVDDLALDSSMETSGQGTEQLMMLPFHDSVEHFKRMRLQEAISKAGGNKTRAAQALQLQPTYLSRLCRQLNIS